MKYEVYYNGKPTGIMVAEKSISLNELRKKIPTAQPIGNIDFKLKKKNNKVL